jgi:prepilin-type N-terminal cleavage/methylation domain-containing protein
MRSTRKQSGFSILEVLTTLAIMAVLVSLVLGLGKRIKAQAREDLCKSGIDIINCALQEYYDQYTAFPFTADFAFDQADLDLLLDAEFGGGSIAGTVKDAYASSEALFYCLDRKCPNSRKLIDKLAISLTAGGRQYDDGTDLLDLVRFVDPWGNALRYTYSAGDVFPVVDSAGADGVFGTSDDLEGD